MLSEFIDVIDLRVIFTKDASEIYERKKTNRISFMRKMSIDHEMNKKNKIKMLQIFSFFKLYEDVQ